MIQMYVYNSILAGRLEDYWLAPGRLLAALGGCWLAPGNACWPLGRLLLLAALGGAGWPLGGLAALEDYWLAPGKAATGCCAGCAES